MHILITSTYTHTWVKHRLYCHTVTWPLYHKEYVPYSMRYISTIAIGQMHTSEVSVEDWHHVGESEHWQGWSSAPRRSFPWLWHHLSTLNTWSTANRQGPCPWVAGTLQVRCRVQMASHWTQTNHQVYTKSCLRLVLWVNLHLPITADQIQSGKPLGSS